MRIRKITKHFEAGRYELLVPVCKASKGTAKERRQKLLQTF